MNQFIKSAYKRLGLAITLAAAWGGSAAWAQPPERPRGNGRSAGGNGDVVAWADAGQPLRGQRWRLQCNSFQGNVAQFADARPFGQERRSDGVMSFGTVSDPAGGADPVFVFSADLRNQLVNNAPRCEGVFAAPETRMTPGKVFWTAATVWLDDWSGTRPGDSQLFLQWHGVVGSLNPSFALYVQGNRLTGVVRYNPDAVPDKRGTGQQQLFALDGGFQRRWLRIVVRGREGLDPADEPQLAMWIDGRQVADYQGPIGYRNNDGDILKFGIYKWIKDARQVWDERVPTRSVFFKNVMLVRDEGQRYDVQKIMDMMGR